MGLVLTCDECGARAEGDPAYCPVCEPRDDDATRAGPSPAAPAHDYATWTCDVCGGAADDWCVRNNQPPMCERVECASHDETRDDEEQPRKKPTELLDGLLG